MWGTDEYLKIHLIANWHAILKKKWCKTFPGFWNLPTLASIVRKDRYSHSLSTSYKPCFSLPRLTHPRHLSLLDFCFLPVILGSYHFPPPLKYAPLAAFLMSACRWLVFDLYEPERPRMRRRIYTHPVTSPLAVCACLVLLPYLTAHRCSPKYIKTWITEVHRYLSDIPHKRTCGSLSTFRIVNKSVTDNGGWCSEPVYDSSHCYRVTSQMYLRDAQVLCKRACIILDALSILDKKKVHVIRWREFNNHDKHY